MKSVKLDRVGEKYNTNQGFEAEIIAYDGRKKCTIRFDDGTIIKDIRFFHLKAGKVKNPNHKSTYGIGYLGVGEYKKHIDGKQCRNYSRWKGMLSRCYSGEYSSYKEVTVCEEWHNFQNFAKWFEEKWKPWMDKSWDLDKDILVKGNKIYSPETCAFIPQEINNILLRGGKGNSKYLESSENKKYTVTVSKYGKSERYYVECSSEEAFQIYKLEKEQYIKVIADKWKPLIENGVYQAFYNYNVEIDD